MVLEEICIFKQASKSQRKNELERGCNYFFAIVNNEELKIPFGCEGFYKKGCYSCDGKKENDCLFYYALPQ